MQQEELMLKEKMVPTDFEVSDSSLLKNDSTSEKISIAANIRFLLAGIFFGIILVKAEVISWFRIQEMFRLQSFHMYGVIGSAVVTGMISVWIIKKMKIKSADGSIINIPKKKFHKGQIYGGLIFGLGWAMTGACPGPLFAQIGTGALVTVVTLFAAIIGTWVYGALQHKLPH